MKTLSEHKIKSLNESIPQLVGGQIKKFRKVKNLTQTELALSVGKDRQYLYKIEKGVVKPNIVTISILAVALDIQLSDLFTDIKL